MTVEVRYLFLDGRYPRVRIGRWTKTQASLPNKEAVLFLLFGLLRRGQITLRRLVGWVSAGQ